jgi:hypothetical protein
MRLPVLALILAGAGFLVFGVAMSVAPQAVMASVGWQIPDGVPTTEVRAFYGGLELALGGLLLAAARLPAYRRAGLVLGAVSYGTVALTRAFGLLIDDTGGPFLLGALATEITLALLCAYAWTKS